jgi:hypothetical protein
MAWKRSTDSRTTRGYGAEHKAERKRRLARYSPSDPCVYCQQPLGDDRSLWHLPHNESRTGYLPGFSCASCNLKDGARRGRAMRDRKTDVTKIVW